WKKNRSELTEEDYRNFYTEKRFGFDQPLAHIHTSVDGAIRYNAILFIPENIPFDYYSKDFEKGLELYSNGVLIMEKCADLQQDRQLKRIANNIQKKIKSELVQMMKNDREKYETFFKAFGRQLKYGVYSDFGANKDTLQDLLLFHSSTEQKLTSLEEYINRMPEKQKYIYYASGESNERIAKLPQTERATDEGYEII